LNKKYNSIIKPKIESLNGENLTEAIQIVAKLAIINYMYETEDKKKFNFIEKKIKRLDKSIIPNIFIEIIKICIEKNKENNENKNNEEEEEERENDDQNENDKKKQLEEQIEIDEKKIKVKETNENNGKNEGEEDNNDLNFQKLRDYIFKNFIENLNSLDDINNIINLLNCLEERYKNKDNDTIKDNIKNNDGNKKEKKKIIDKFLQDLIGKYLFTETEFFSNNPNIKISLLYNLFISGKIEKSEEGNDDANNLKVREIDSKSSNLSSNGYIDIGTPYDVWPLHLKKNFP